MVNNDQFKWLKVGIGDGVFALRKNATIDNGTLESGEKKGLTQPQLAEEVSKKNGGVTLYFSDISDVERGEVNFHISKLDKICNIFNLSLYDFFDKQINEGGLLDNYAGLKKCWNENKTGKYFDNFDSKLVAERKKAKLAQYELCEVATTVSNFFEETGKYSQTWISTHENEKNKNYHEMSLIDFFIIFLALHIDEEALKKEAAREEAARDEAAREEAAKEEAAKEEAQKKGREKISIK